MIDDTQLNAWFCREVLPLELALTRFIARNWRVADDVVDIRQEVYALALNGARAGLPQQNNRYVYTIARNLLINRAKRAKIVSFDLFADFDDIDRDIDLFATHRLVEARAELRRTQAGLDGLPPRCREIVRLRKVEGLTTREAAERLGVGIDTIERQLTLGMRALVDFMLGGTGKITRTKSDRARHRSGGE
ncbi:RNA polymerase sigma factor [Sphingomonas hylomeconis]|uniref:RNA polymerase sigma factor n=1 Tax=Sphingomonas hylomeconis TaxID=1395958 RepID=A0ABV7ST27_9SPHN|nr:RNA polymerase sigma factor [Sphingomonas hylomeconis]